jgi:preprotein translocase subunit SecA
MRSSDLHRHNAPAQTRLELYPQKNEATLSGFDAGFLSFISYFSPFFNIKRPMGENSRLVKRTVAEWNKLSGDFENCLHELKLLKLFLKHGINNNSDKDISRLVAILMKFSAKHLNQTPYDVQIAAVWSLIRGEIAEMGTGEGKSLTAAVAAAALAVCGQQVHILTVNDYLADRDYKRFEKFFSALNLSSGCIYEDSSNEERSEVYLKDIVFSAAKSVVFDYLKDKTSLNQYPFDSLYFKLERVKSSYCLNSAPIMRGLDAVIIDEADSVLIDQAATPFILSGNETSFGGLDIEVLAEVFEISKILSPDLHYKVFEQLKRVNLTEEGKLFLESLSYQHSILNVMAIREHVIKQALVASQVFKAGQDYLVQDDAIQIIDESTGRVMPDRQWSDGLHQLVELKEHVSLSEMRTTLGRITFQRFFPRYRHLCGMTGTARPASRELWESYGLSVRRILPRRKDLRVWPKVKIYSTAQQKWAAIADYADQCSKNFSPILIGTRTVTASLECSAALRERDIPHHILNAENVEKEAQIIGQAGIPSRVTVATNMAGRGTDILLSPVSREHGGLHVILSELHDNRRIDLQLAGRCGRQGDPGTVIRFLSLEDGLVKSVKKSERLLLNLLLKFGFHDLIYILFLLLQRKQTRRSQASRRRLQKYERERQKSLSLTGILE